MTQLEELNKNRTTVYLEDGSYIINPYYEDYNQGNGPEMTGGDLYSKDGKHIGHLDPCGLRGEEGIKGIHKHK